MISVNMWAHEVILHRGSRTLISSVNKQGEIWASLCGKVYLDPPHQELNLLWVFEQIIFKSLEVLVFLSVTCRWAF